MSFIPGRISAKFYIVLYTNSRPLSLCSMNGAQNIQKMSISWYASSWAVCGIFMKSELVVVISFNIHNTTFASWHIFTCHNALRLFKNSHDTKYGVVAVSVMPQRVVVVFPAHWEFSIFELNIYNIKRHLTKTVELNAKFEVHMVVLLKMCQFAKDVSVLLKKCRCCWRCVGVAEDVSVLLKMCRFAKDVSVLLKKCRCCWRCVGVAEEVSVCWRSVGVAENVSVLLKKWRYCWRCVGVAEDVSVLLKMCRRCWRCAVVAEEVSVCWRSVSVAEDVWMLLKMCWCCWRCDGVTEDVWVLLNMLRSCWKFVGVPEDVTVLLQMCGCCWRCVGVAEDVTVLLKMCGCCWRRVGVV